MKYEEIKIGESYTVNNVKEKVIAKVDEDKSVATVDLAGVITGWYGRELESFEPIELPEEGLLVSKAGSLVYKLSDGSGYGFVFGDQSEYYLNKGWGFTNDGYWRKATPEQEERFVEMLEKECEKHGLYEDTKIEKYANGDSLAFPDYMGFGPAGNTTEVWNKNGRIFYRGNFATPRKEETIPTQASIEQINTTVVEFGRNAGVVGYIKYTDEGKYYSVNSYSLESASPDFDSTDFLADYFEDRGKLVVVEPDAND